MMMSNYFVNFFETSLKTVGVDFTPKPPASGPPKTPLKFKAIFLHGFTSSYHSLLSWAEKLCPLGGKVTLLGLPGHFLNNPKTPSLKELSVENFFHLSANLFDEIDSLDSFKTKTNVKINTTTNIPTIWGGHSLGGLLALLQALKSSNPPDLILSVASIPTQEPTKPKLLSSFFESTLSKRLLYVDPLLQSSQFFEKLSWYKFQNFQNMSQKSLEWKQKKLFFITGKNDILAPPKDLYLLNEVESTKGVNVDVLENLPHSSPELVASHLKFLIKSKIQL